MVFQIGSDLHQPGDHGRIGAALGHLEQGSGGFTSVIAVLRHELISPAAIPVPSLLIQKGGFRSGEVFKKIPSENATRYAGVEGPFAGHDPPPSCGRPQLASAARP